MSEEFLDILWEAVLGCLRYLEIDVECSKNAWTLILNVLMILRFRLNVPNVLEHCGKSVLQCSKSTSTLDLNVPQRFEHYGCAHYQMSHRYSDNDLECP